MAFLTQVEGCNVYVYYRGVDGCHCFVEDFFVENLFFMLIENGLWAVECSGVCLIFDGLELVKIER
jgi:hypothetical protein